MRLLSRRAFLATVAGSGLGAAGLGGYALAVEPTSLRLQRYALNPPGWTPGLGLRIAVLADLHAGMPATPMGRVHEIIARTNELEPDLVLLLGDYSNTDRLLRITADWSQVIPALTGLKARLGRFAILGNHEWWDDRTAQKTRRGPTVAHGVFAETDIPLLRTTRSGSRRTAARSGCSGLATSSPSGSGTAGTRASTTSRARSPS